MCQTWKSWMTVWFPSAAPCACCHPRILARIWPAWWSIRAWRHQKKGQHTFLRKVCFSLSLNYFPVSHTQTWPAAFILFPSPPCCLLQDPICWVCTWRESWTLPSGWQCVTAQGLVPGPTSSGFFLKMPGAKHPCSMKVMCWELDWHISSIWPSTRGRIWPACIITDTESGRRSLFPSPDTVSLQFSR